MGSEYNWSTFYIYIYVYIHKNIIIKPLKSIKKVVKKEYLNGSEYDQSILHACM
jgi:hypothetical protein